MRPLRPRRFPIYILSPILACALLLLGVGVGAAGGPNPIFLPIINHGPAVGPPAGEPWSNPATWGGRLPQAGDAVVIPSGKTVLLDVSPPALRSLSINGALVFAEQDLSLSAGWIMLHGRLAIGAQGRPFPNRATITLTASDPNEDVMQMGTRGIIGA
jgi:G8 domain